VCASTEGNKTKGGSEFNAVLTNCGGRRLGRGGEGERRRLRRGDLQDLVVAAGGVRVVVLAEAAHELAEVGLEVIPRGGSLPAGPRPQQVGRDPAGLALQLLLLLCRRPGRPDEAGEDGAAAHRSRRRRNRRRRSGVGVGGLLVGREGTGAQ
jgi:hypothetical protein